MQEITSQARIDKALVFARLAIFMDRRPSGNNNGAYFRQWLKHRPIGEWQRHLAEPAASDSHLDVGGLRDNVICFHMLHRLSDHSRFRLLRPASVQRRSLVLLMVLWTGPRFTQAIGVQKVHPITGRVIAHAMSVDGAAWLDRPEREREEQPEKAIAALHLAPGMKVGEVGAGTGFYALRIATRIQPGGVYYANDLEAGMLSRLESKAVGQRITNIQTIRGSQTDTRLPRGALDYVLMVDVYHELSEPQRILRDIAAALKPNGRLVLLEFRKEDPNIPIRPEHKMTAKDVETELSAEGYVLDDLIETLPRQHMFFFRRLGPAE